MCVGSALLQLNHENFGSPDFPVAYMPMNHGANFQARKTSLSGPTGHAFFELRFTFFSAVTWLNEGLEKPEKRDNESFDP